MLGCPDRGGSPRSREREFVVRPCAPAPTNSRSRLRVRLLPDETDDKNFTFLAGHSMRNSVSMDTDGPRTPTTLRTLRGG